VSELVEEFLKPPGLRSCLEPSPTVSFLSIFLHNIVVNMKNVWQLEDITNSEFLLSSLFWFLCITGR
jgi:hypothetical protein